ncbi:uroporphyrinogen-III C-methyltransferase [Metabacillus litoralis]|uniref:uroporphyrinogen-III C-methyltransferase n=1 Tax=Metabacillus TaxID=2675233 RepID=UPI001E5365A6|nr:uroporphyrinogen-III C-methyltransferase [Metabacillus litoralis]MCM3162485.1 uroporphyrinogen-III C-methyltransferase [Metabacillus litoralis]UHA61205.1 uroporphyrinogen-III C-methyltransferase [Metabacillus litoralis]
MGMSIGKVYLVGAGPGDQELITVKGMEAIKKADVILYDRLVNPRLLEYAPPTCELIYCGKLPTRHFMRQHEINATLAEKALAGFTVVRLKGGDPSVFGRVGEEAEVLAEQNVPYEIVPGITSGIAAPLYAGIPVTHRDYAGSFAVVTAHDKSKEGKPNIDWEGLARGVQTIAFYMGISNLEHICENLVLHGKSPDTPVIIIRWGTWSRQQSVVGTLSTIVEKVREEKIQNPAITLVGDIVETRDKVKWFENQPLFGQQILYVRGSAEEESNAQNLRNQGADVIECPKWTVTENEVDSELLGRLSSYKSILFLSSQAVTAFFNQLKRHRVDIRQIRAELCCQNETALNQLELLGLYPSLEMPGQENLLIVGSEITAKRKLNLDSTYKEYDYLSIYQSYIDQRYDSIIKRSIEDAELTSIVFTSGDAVETWINGKFHENMFSQENEQSLEIICENDEALDAVLKHGLPAKLNMELSLI